MSGLAARVATCGALRRLFDLRERRRVVEAHHATVGVSAANVDIVGLAARALADAIEFDHLRDVDPLLAIVERAVPGFDFRVFGIECCLAVLDTLVARERGDDETRVRSAVGHHRIGVTRVDELLDQRAMLFEGEGLCRGREGRQAKRRSDGCDACDLAHGSHHDACGALEKSIRHCLTYSRGREGRVCEPALSIAEQCGHAMTHLMSRWHAPLAKKLDRILKDSGEAASILTEKEAAHARRVSP